jgi:hypothetical protein
MRGVAIFLFLFAFLPTVACGKSCGKMTQELQRLRQDYHKYATSAQPDGAAIAFDGLVAILDKIVALKHDMQRSHCPLPPRGKSAPPKP